MSKGLQVNYLRSITAPWGGMSTNPNAAVCIRHSERSNRVSGTKIAKLGRDPTAEPWEPWLSQKTSSVQLQMNPEMAPCSNGRAVRQGCQQVPTEKKSWIKRCPK